MAPPFSSNGDKPSAASTQLPLHSLISTLPLSTMKNKEQDQVGRENEEEKDEKTRKKRKD
jgi:hypothetical protein